MQNKEVYTGLEFDKPHDECGIVVVVSPDYNAGQLAAAAISELDNRGHEMTGIVADIDGMMPVLKNFGTGRDLFPDGGYIYNFANPSKRAMAHGRYSTQGTQELEGAQPHELVRIINGRRVSMAHIENGNLTNTHKLAEVQGLTGKDYITDNHLMLLTFMNNATDILNDNPDQPLDVVELMTRTLPMFEGAFTSALMLNDCTVVYNDHHGLKPAVIGTLPNGGITVASELTALEAEDATLVREMNSGEIIIIDNDCSWEAMQWAEPEPRRCVLEVLYVMRPETKAGTLTSFGGVAIKEARRNAGRALAEGDVLDVDFGFGIPNSGVPVGEGYCEASGIPYNQEALIANKDRRSFNEPTPEKREETAGGKLVANHDLLRGKKAAGGEDSLIRGTTGKKNSAIMKKAGVTEFHMLIGAPMLIDTCDLGIDLGTADELLAARAAKELGIDLSGGYDCLSPTQVAAMIEEMRAYIDVDSLRFLTPDQLREKVLGEKAGEFCMKCMTGEKPDPRPIVVDIRRKSAKTESLVV